MRQIELDHRVYRNHAVGGTGSPVVVQEEAMIAIIVILFLALIGAAYAIHVRQRTSSDADGDHVLPAPPFVGLFEHTDADLIRVETQRTIGSITVNLLDRAANGDLSVLAEAHTTGDEACYSEVLGTLTEWASARQEDLWALASQVSKSNGLRANKKLAQQLIEAWQTAPDRGSIAEMIHIAALSDDAVTYEQAIDAALESWRQGKLAQFSIEELAALLVSQYWLISPEARLGGVGFALKRRLLGVRRELATAAPGR